MVAHVAFAIRRDVRPGGAFLIGDSKIVARKFVEAGDALGEYGVSHLR
jgi:hypothetical protein